MLHLRTQEFQLSKGNSSEQDDSKSDAEDIQPWLCTTSIALESVFFSRSNAELTANLESSVSTKHSRWSDGAGRFTHFAALRQNDAHPVQQTQQNTLASLRVKGRKRRNALLLPLDREIGFGGKTLPIQPEWRQGILEEAGGELQNRNRSNFVRRSAVFYTLHGKRRGKLDFSSSSSIHAFHRQRCNLTE